MVGDFFEEFRAFQAAGGPSYISPSAGLLYYACLGAWNEQYRPDVVTVAHAVLRMRSGIDERKTYWRARQELSETGLIEVLSDGRVTISYRLLGIEGAFARLSSSGGQIPGHKYGRETGKNVPVDVPENVPGQETGKNVPENVSTLSPTCPQLVPGEIVTRSAATPGETPKGKGKRKSTGTPPPPDEESDRSQVEEALVRYSPAEQKTIRAFIEGLKGTRRSRQIAWSVVAAELAYYEQHEPDVVAAGLSAYLDALADDPTKREAYARACVRGAAERKRRGVNGNGRPASPAANGRRNTTDGRQRATPPEERSDADLLLDGYTREQIRALRARQSALSEAGGTSGDTADIP